MKTQDTRVRCLPVEAVPALTSLLRGENVRASLACCRAIPSVKNLPVRPDAGKGIRYGR